MVTIKDVAYVAGVSATTVSNVINGKHSRVSKQTIQKINKAIDELGYVPNMSARSLVSNSSNVIGFVNYAITNEDFNFMEDPFLSKFIGILERILRENGYYLMLRTVENPEQFHAFLRNWHIDGLFLMGISNDDIFNAITPLPIPTVLIDSYVRQDDVYNVGVEDFNGINQTTKYLIDKGHKNIAYASFKITKDNRVLMERFLGYKSALIENSIPFDPKLVFECDADFEHTREISDYVANHPEVTAIVTTSDYLAVNIMVNLHKRGIKIPDDVSIVGFDNLNICEFVSPTLTTVQQDLNKKCIAAVNFMLQLLNEQKPIDNECTLKTYIVERESVRSI